MRSWCRAIFCSGVVSVLTLSWTTTPRAQETAAAAAVSVSAEATIADEGPSGDAFIDRYPPLANTVEIGVFGGLLFISDENSFRGPATASSGRTTLQPYSQFKQPGPEVGARVAYFPLSFLGGEVEGMIATAESDTSDNTTVLAGRLHAVVQAPFWSVVPFAIGGAGYWATLSDYSGDDNDPAFHFGAGVKVAASDDIAFRLDVRDNITNKRAISDYPNNLEVTAGASLVLGRAKPAPSDSDGDGFTAPVERCPSEPGVAPDGCPLRDADGDQILDASDRCPSQPGLAPTGCPSDLDADGVIDQQDQCVNEAGPAPRGCPDSDGDGSFDPDDQCPAVAGTDPFGCPVDGDEDGLVEPDDKCPAQAEIKNGFEDADGCPDEIPQALRDFTGVIAGIEFDVNSGTIRPSSHAMLDQAAQILNEYPALRLQVVGHTDDTGARAHNLDLSLERAQSVHSYLVSRGVAAERLESRGVGPDSPLIAEKTTAARQKNRRIEFNIIK